MNAAMILFRTGAFLALLLLCRHVWRTGSPRAALALVTYLVVVAAIRESVVRALTRAIDVPLPYTPNQGLGQVGFVNVVVVVGWVFTALLSFELAKMIQRASFPGTNIFLTLALTALVTTTISYAVEITGMRIHLWTWTAPEPVTWLPFEWPFDAFEGWAATSFMMMFVYSAVRWRLFSPTAWKSATVTFGVVMLYGLSDLAQPWLGPESPRKKLTLVYVLLSVALGFRAPAWLLGSSRVAPEGVADPYPEAARAG